MARANLRALPCFLGLRGGLCQRLHGFESSRLRDGFTALKLQLAGGAAAEAASGREGLEQSLAAAVGKAARSRLCWLGPRQVLSSCPWLNPRQ